jgi:hypothetical protein
MKRQGNFGVCLYGPRALHFLNHEYVGRVLPVGVTGGPILRHVCNLSLLILPQQILG